MHDILELIADAKLTPPGPRLEDEDLLRELASLDPPSAASTITRLRHSHHLLARALAEGRSNISAAAISGYAPSTVTALKRDPAFQELLAHYKSQADDIFASVQDRLGALGLSFLDELQHRLENEPESFKVGQLLAMAQALLDRSIAPTRAAKAGGPVGGPTSVSVNIRFAGEPKPVLDLVPIKPSELP